MSRFLHLCVINASTTNRPRNNNHLASPALPFQKALENRFSMQQNWKPTERANSYQQWHFERHATNSILDLPWNQIAVMLHYRRDDLISRLEVFKALYNATERPGPTKVRPSSFSLHFLIPSRRRRRRRRKKKKTSAHPAVSHKVDCLRRIARPDDLRRGAGVDKAGHLSPNRPSKHNLHPHILSTTNPSRRYSSPTCTRARS